VAADVRGGAIQKPTWTVNSEGTSVSTVGYQTQIAMPGYVVNKRQAGLAPWSGFADDPMEESAPRLVAIEFENAVWCTRTQGAAGGILDRFSLGCKFRGYGGPANGEQTEDVNVGIGMGAGGNAFPDMQVTTEQDGSPLDTSTILVFRHLVLIPETVSDGDMIEVITYATIDTDAETEPTTVMQWIAAKYRFIVPPFTQDPNTGLRVPASEQPRFDTGQYEP